MTFGQRILEIRKDLHLSQASFGEMANVSQRTVAFWESGQRMPSHMVITDLADKLNVSVDYLLGRSDKLISTNKKQPAVQDGELLSDVISRVQDLPDSALPFVYAFLDGIQAGREIAQADAADPDPDAGSVR